MKAWQQYIYRNGEVMIQLMIMLSLSILAASADVREVQKTGNTNNRIAIEMDITLIVPEQDSTLKPPEPQLTATKGSLTTADTAEAATARLDYPWTVDHHWFNAKPYPPVIQTEYTNSSRPQFPGGRRALQAYIEKQLRYPEVAKRQGIQGKVFVRVQINEQGWVEESEVLRSIHPLLDAESLRICKTLPRWRPAYQYGNPVMASYSFPVVFQLRKKN